MGRTKFDNLRSYLEGETRNNFYLSFLEIERIIGQPLCPSAYMHYAYWYPSPTHTLAVLIYQCGFSIETDLSNHRIKLSR